MRDRQADILLTEIKVIADLFVIDLFVYDSPHTYITFMNTDIYYLILEIISTHSFDLPPTADSPGYLLTTTLVLQPLKIFFKLRFLLFLTISMK